VRARFSPERWQDFKRDMKYFADTMGEADYLASLQEHGGDATPAWILPAYLLFSHLPAKEWTLTATGLIDPVLILLLFFVIARTFGLRVMLYLVVLWGTSDFYTFGTNLMGATLRQDWPGGSRVGRLCPKRLGALLGRCSFGLRRTGPRVPQRRRPCSWPCPSLVCCRHLA